MTAGWNKTNSLTRPQLATLTDSSPNLDAMCCCGTLRERSQLERLLFNNSCFKKLLGMVILFMCSNKKKSYFQIANAIVGARKMMAH